MFLSYKNEFKYNLRVKLVTSEIIDIFTSEDMENTLPKSWTRILMNFSSPIFSSKALVST